MTAPPRAYLILVGAQFATGAAAIFARFAMHQCGPIAAAGIRLTIAAILIAFYLQLTQSKEKVARRDELLLAAGGVALAVHFGSWVASLLYTSVAVSTLLVSTSPAYTTLYDTLFLKKPAPLSFWGALMFAIGGVTLIVTNTAAKVPIVGLELLGNSLAIAGGIALAFYLLLVRSLIDKYKTLTIVSRSYSWAAVSLLITALAMHERFPGTDATSWGGIIAMALVSQVLGHTGINASLRWFSSNIVAFSTLLEPVLAAVLACIFFAEFLSVSQIVGCLIVLACLAVILAPQRPDVIAATTPDL
jgi:drug/metabolite transporter (DMT)-like permease